MTSKKEIDDVKNKIVKWCTNEGIFKKYLKDDEKANFHLLLHYPENSNNPIDVVQPKDKDDVIVIGAGTQVSPQHVNEIKKLSSDKKMELIQELRMLLGPRPTEFELKHPNEILELFVITSPIYFDGLTKDRFMSTIREVFKSKLIGIWKIQEKLGVPNQKENEIQTSMYG
jgi:hypothetical protein